MTSLARPRGRWFSGLVGAFLALVGACGMEGVARACSPAMDVPVTDGLGGETVTHVPRNYGYVRDRAGRVPIAGSTPPLYRDATPLSVGRLPGGSDVNVDDVVDSTAPSRPSLRSGTLSVQPGGNGCFADTTRSLELELEADPTDNHTSPRDLTYVIFAGDTKAAAETAASPAALRVSEVPATVRFRHSAPDLRWFSVAAIDLAGNISPRSDAIEVDVRDYGDGCAMSPTRGSARWPFACTAALALALLACRRRRQVGSEADHRPSA